MMQQPQGRAAASVAQIARRAGVSERTFFHYFPAKADVLSDISPDDIDRLQQHVRVGEAGYAAKR
jgi:AcrR family transcriptional regulator